MAASPPLLSAAISGAQGILNYLLPMVGQQISLVRGFKDELEKLGSKLELIQDLLHDAENRKVSLKTMQGWLKKLRFAASKAEDVLDELAYEDLRRKMEVQDQFTDKICRCEKLTCLPKALLHKFEFLKDLGIEDCGKLVIPNDALSNLRHCSSLSIKGCGGLQTAWQEGLFFQTGLWQLSVGGFSEELEYLPWPTSSKSFTTAATEEGDDLYTQRHNYQNPFPSLKYLELIGGPKLKCLPDQVQYLTGLQRLSICNFDGLETLPDWLGNLSYLEYLAVYSCEKLVNLPSKGAMLRLSKLAVLCISHCPLLKKRCTEGSGPEWPKISHIRHVDLR